MTILTMMTIAILSRMMMTAVMVFMTTIDCNDENFVDFCGEKGMPVNAVRNVGEISSSVTVMMTMLMMVVMVVMVVMEVAIQIVMTTMMRFVNAHDGFYLPMHWRMKVRQQEGWIKKTRFKRQA